MAAAEAYDILVIGSGESGKYLAWTLAAAGHRTAVVERKLIGGSCPNIACLPSKNIIQSAKVRSFTRRAAEFGVDLDSAVTNMKGVQARKQGMLAALREVHLGRYRASGAELIMGEARFSGERTEHLIVIGGGYIGLELAQAMRRFGEQATVIEAGPQPLGHEDADVTAGIVGLFADEGITLHRQTKVRSVDGESGRSVRVVAEGPDGELVIDGTDLLVAVGRTPNTGSIGHL